MTMENNKEKNNHSKKEIRKEENLNFKCEQFFGKNWKYVGLFIGLSLLIVAYEVSNISSRMEKLEKVVEDNNGKVVLTTSDGRALKVTKEPLRAEYLKQYAISVYVNNFIVSKSQLTNNFEKNSFKNYGEVLKGVPTLRNIFYYYIDSKADDAKNIKVNKKALGDLIAYTQWLISAVAEDKLPEYISIKDYSLDKYEYNGNKYKIELSIKVIAQSWIISQGAYTQQQGIFKIVSEGSFDLSKSNDINPYGLRIESLKIYPLIKSNSSNI
ncbi:hypothetical protein ABZL51_001617 [Campylobacter jejuni]|uniref:Uncharacterized protein n=2 Tax=Campylobacter jejuni TaxID=197 RepID=A0A431EIC2_CAMJU|nr:MULTISPECIES: hypothetical protein [Campylobacter]EAK3496111.1 hypothetical protein [Campylobacter jejuni]ECL3018560.1 hypothetical protein [Campylobacter jejuni]ECL6143835.1 hypothetical protein [Campylobacter jejuni]ECO2639563.1 hypothetical protein [Campylobacter jejuni]ECQ7086225.1 hypothetical protein [Campylobacter jejuni]